MIALSWLFLLAAIATLVVGVLTEPIAWIYASIGSSVLAMILLVVGIVRGKPVQPATAGAPYGPPIGSEGARERPAAAAAASASSTAVAARPAPAAASTAPARKPAARKPAAAKAPATKPAAAKAPATKAPAAKAPGTKTSAAKPATRKPAAKKTSAKKTTAASASSRARVVAIPERGTYHKADCRYVQGRTDTEQLQASTAKSRGFKACGVCKP